MAIVDDELLLLETLERPLADDPRPALARLDDGSVLVRDFGELERFVRFVDGDFQVETRSVPRGALRHIEGRTYVLPSQGVGFVYDAGLFVELPARPRWPFLPDVERQATIGGRALFNLDEMVAERVAQDAVCPVADLGRDDWDAVEAWGDAWAFLEGGGAREAGLFLVRPSGSRPVCATP